MFSHPLRGGYLVQGGMGRASFSVLAHKVLDCRSERKKTQSAPAFALTSTYRFPFLAVKKERCFAVGPKRGGKKVKVGGGGKEGIYRTSTKSWYLYSEVGQIMDASDKSHGVTCCRGLAQH